MSAVWSTTWRILGIGLKTAPLGQNSFSSTAIILANGSKRTLLAASFPRFIRTESKVSKYRLNIVRGLTNTQKLPRKFAPLKYAPIWRVAISTRPSSASEFEEVSVAEIRAIFGGSLDWRRGNELLQTLQYQRVSGTLDQEISASPIHIARGLNWLRSVIPVDEDAAIIQRLEREETLEMKTDGLYGQQSVLDEWIDYNKQKAAHKEAAKDDTSKAENISKDKSKTARSSTAISSRRAARPQWVQRYWDEAVSQHKAPPNMSKFQRLGPSTAVLFAVVVLSILFAQNYVPPSRQARLWPDLPPAAATIGALIGINFIVFVAWRLPPALKFMNKHFLMVPAIPHASSIIGSMFSHQSFLHLAANMVGIWIIGTKLHDEVGRGTFIAVYLSTGVISVYASFSRYVLQNILYTCTLGASGALTGLIGTLCWLHIDKWPFPIFEEFTQGGSYTLMLWFLIVVDVAGLLVNRQHLIRTDHVAHLGGYAAGIVAGEALKFRAGVRRQRATEGKNKMPLTDESARGLRQAKAQPKS